MTYTKSFSPDDYELIAPTLQKIQDLKDGERLVLSGLSPEDKAALRYKLYNWLHHTGLKKHFRIKTLQKDLVVMRKSFTGLQTFLEKDSLESSVEEIFKEMIQSDEPKALAKTKAQEGTITEEQALDLIERYNKVMS